MAQALKLTEEEKAICKEYSTRGPDGYVRRNECPLVVIRYSNVACKATCHLDEYGEWVPDGWEDENEQDISIQR